MKELDTFSFRPSPFGENLEMREISEWVAEDPEHRRVCFQLEDDVMSGFVFTEKETT
jgi:hypothetical protein